MMTAKIDEDALERIKNDDKGSHSRRKIAPPTLADFERVAEVTNGRMGKIAEAFGVSISTVYRWRDEEEGFNDALNKPREIMMDKLVSTAELIAIGIPLIEETEDGKQRVVGWTEYPNVPTLHKLMDVYGMMRGFGKNPQEVNVNVSGGVPIANWLNLNTTKETSEE